MEVLGGGTTVISVLQTAWQVINYVKAVRSAGEAQQKVLIELIRARTLLNSLSDVAENFKNDEWFRALQSLDGPDGVLSDFKSLLEWIMDEMSIPSPQQQKVSPLIPTSETLGLREKIRRKFSSRLFSSTPTTNEPKPDNPDNSRDRSSNTGLENAIKDIVWPFKEAEVEKLLSKLEGIKTHLLLALSSDNVRLSRLIQDQLHSVHGDIKVLREHQEGSKAWTTQQDMIFRSISSINFSSDRFPDDIAKFKWSASALLQDRIFAEWLTNNTCETSLLLSGIPGSGKTSMCRVVENYLRNLASSSETFVVAVYFSLQNQDKAQSLQTVLAFIVETMLHQRPQIQKYYNRLMLTGEGPLEVEDSLRIIHRARQDFQNFYILIDALDQCDAQQAQLIVERLTQLRNPLRVFATSRKIPVTTHFSKKLEIERLYYDGVRRYISRTLSAKVPVASGSPSRDDSAELERIVEAILQRSEGQFTTAKLLIEQIPDHATTQQVDQILRSVVLSLEHIYTHIVEEINSQADGDAAMGRKVLSELLVAQEPITTETLLNTVARDAGWERTSDQVQIEQRIDWCVRCCGGLIARSDADIVGFVDGFAQRYLERYGVSTET